MSWQSPYQTSAYSRCLALAGVETRVLSAPSAAYFDRFTTPELTAWETDLDVEQLAPNAAIYNFQGLCELGRLSWQGARYCTLLVELEGTRRYAPELRRNVNKATRAGLRFEPEQPYERLSGLFAREEFRAMLPPALFERATRAMLGTCADAHLVALGGETLAGAIVLRSAQVANVRFVGSTEMGRSLQAGAFLYDRLVDYYREAGFQYVDLSGFAPPTAEERLLRINAFKSKFTNLAAVFRKHPRDPSDGME